MAARGRRPGARASRCTALLPAPPLLPVGRAGARARRRGSPTTGCAPRRRRCARSLALPISPLLEADRARGSARRASSAMLERMRAGEPPLATRDGVFTTARRPLRGAPARDAALRVRHRRAGAAARRRSARRFADAARAARPDLVLEQSGANRFAVDAETKHPRRRVADLDALDGRRRAALAGCSSARCSRSGSSMVPALVGLAGRDGGSARGLRPPRRDDDRVRRVADRCHRSTTRRTSSILWSLSTRDESRRGGSRGGSAARSRWRRSPRSRASSGSRFTSFPRLPRARRVLGIGVAGALLASLFLLPDLVPRRRRVRPVSAQPRASGSAPWIPRAAAGTAARSRSCRSRRARARRGRAAAPALERRPVAARPARPATCAPRTTRVRERVSNFDGGRFVIALGDDAESALARNDAVYARLARAGRRAASSAACARCTTCCGRRSCSSGTSPRCARARTCPRGSTRPSRAPASGRARSRRSRARSPRRRRRSRSRSCARRRSAPLACDARARARRAAPR